MASAVSSGSASANSAIQEEFIKAVEEGDQRKVAQLFVEGVDPNYLTEKGTALHIAAQKADRVMTEILLRNGADPNIPKEIKIIEDEEIWSDGSDGEFVDKVYYQEGGETPFWEAADSRNTEIAKLLLKNGASPFVVPVYDDSYICPHHQVKTALEAKDWIFAKAMLATKYVEDLSVDDATELLDIAIMMENIDAIEMILASFPKFNFPESLIDFADEDFGEILQEIIKKCSPSNVDEQFIISLLMDDQPAIRDSIKKVEDIFNIKIYNESIFNILEYYYDEEEIQFVSATIEEIINTPVGDEGSTLLIEAVKDANKDRVNTLLRYGAKPDIVDHQGMAALDYAAQNLDYEMARLLVDYGAELDKAIEFADDALDHSDEVISLLKSLFGSETKACLS